MSNLLLVVPSHSPVVIPQTILKSASYKKLINGYWNINNAPKSGNAYNNAMNRARQRAAALVKYRISQGMPPIPNAFIVVNATPVKLVTNTVKSRKNTGRTKKGSVKNILKQRKKLLKNNLR